jgi:PTH1 family peptidyl-tRNA hydrolase
MLLIAGLGNPGRRYAGNRHNVGFMVADAIHHRHGFSPWRVRFESELSEGLLGGEKAILLKPATFMNESGRAVGQALRFYKLSPADLVVVHDELDLPPGKLRVKSGGGNGGHNGLKSLDQHIGKEYRRVRIGIGHPGAKELVSGYVLHDFAKADSEWLDPLIDAIAENATLLAQGNDANFMNRVHRALGGSAEAHPAKIEKKSAAVSEPPMPVERETSMGALADGLRRLFRRDQGA